MKIEKLVVQAGLPPIRSIRPLTNGRGMDNILNLVTLSDDRQVLARQPIGAAMAADSAPRAAFLSQHQVGAPTVDATSADGSSLVEWIPGTSLAARLADSAAATALPRRPCR